MTEYTIQETAERLGVTVDAIRKRIRRGGLEAKKKNGRWFVQMEEMSTHVPVNDNDRLLDELDFYRNRCRELENQLFKFMTMSFGQQLEKPKKKNKNKNKKKKKKK